MHTEGEARASVFFAHGGRRPSVGMGFEPTHSLLVPTVELLHRRIAESALYAHRGRRPSVEPVPDAIVMSECVLFTPRPKAERAGWDSNPTPLVGSTPPAGAYGGATFLPQAERAVVPEAIVMSERDGSPLHGGEKIHKEPILLQIKQGLAFCIGPFPFNIYQEDFLLDFLYNSIELKAPGLLNLLLTDTLCQAGLRAK
jgi:hypothetical protein